MNMNTIGIMLVLTGIIFLVARAIGIPLGQLPGDIIIRKNGGYFVFPITTMILISLVVSVIRRLLIR
jgi:hypothetical protein